MAEKEIFKVNEQNLQQMIAGEVSHYRTKNDSPAETEKEVEMPQEQPDDSVEVSGQSQPKKETKERKKVGVNQSDFAELFLKENRLSDRRMVYVSKDTYEKLIRYVSVISDRKLGIVGYVDNIVAHHIECYKPAINELYESRIGCKVFKN
jgi:hypothetical protein